MSLHFSLKARIILPLIREAEMKVLCKSKKYHIQNFSSALCSMFFLSVILRKCGKCGTVVEKHCELQAIRPRVSPCYARLVRMEGTVCPFRGGPIWHCSTKAKIVNNKCCYSFFTAKILRLRVKPQSQFSNSKYRSSPEKKSLCAQIIACPLA